MCKKANIPLNSFHMKHNISSFWVFLFYNRCELIVFNKTRYIVDFLSIRVPSA